MKIRRLATVLLVLSLAFAGLSATNSAADDPCEQGCAGVFNTCVGNAGEAYESCITQMEFNRGQCYISASMVYYDCVSFFTTVFPQFQGYDQICLNWEFEAQSTCEENGNNAGAQCQNAYSTAYEICDNAYTHCVGACPTPTPTP